MLVSEGIMLLLSSVGFGLILRDRRKEHLRRSGARETGDDRLVSRIPLQASPFATRSHSSTLAVWRQTAAGQCQSPAQSDRQQKADSLGH